MNLYLSIPGGDPQQNTTPFYFLGILGEVTRRNRGTAYPHGVPGAGEDPGREKQAAGREPAENRESWARLRPSGDDSRAGDKHFFILAALNRWRAGQGVYMPGVWKTSPCIPFS